MRRQLTPTPLGRDSGRSVGAINNQQPARRSLGAGGSTIAPGKRGFTLIELLLYLGLVSFFLTSLTYFAWDVILGSVKAGVHQEVQENLRFVGHKVQVDARNADGINAAESDFGVNLAVNPGTTLSLLGSAPYYPVQFRVDQGALQVRRGVGDWTSLTSSLVEVSDLTFTDLTDSGSENIRFTLTIRHRNLSGRSEWEKEATLETSAQVRQ